MSREFVWYDTNKNELILTTFRFCDVVMSALRGDHVPTAIKQVVITSKKPKFEQGYLLGKDDSRCYYVGEFE